MSKARLEKRADQSELRLGPRVVGVLLAVECGTCEGSGRYALNDQNGEVLDCPICRGKGWVSLKATLYELFNLLRNVARRR